MRAPPRLRGGVPARLGVLLVGLLVFAAGIVALLESRLGLSPWDVLHQGLARHTPLSFGAANIAVGLVVLLAALLLGARLGVGTVANATLVGAFVQLLTSVGWVTRLADEPLHVRIGLLVAGLALMGAGTGLYLGADLGAGPRDSLMVVGARRTRWRIGAVRSALELAALGAGFALGGTVGVGTLAFAVTIGPAVELSFWLLDHTPLVHEAAGPEPGRRDSTPGVSSAKGRIRHDNHEGASMSAIQFGLNISTSAEAGTDPVAAAVRAEELGFDFISCSDHPAGSSATYETWTMLCFIAAATSRIRIATRVLGVPYRAPAMVAKMAETLDRLSAGRLILGLGAGSADDEHRAFGLGVRSPRDKTDGLEEAIRIVRGLWSERSFTFAGRLYQVEAAELEPKPAHHIPIWLGTFAPRALAVTGRYADGWIPSLGYATPDQVVVMRERVLAAARDAGRDPAEITCAYNIEVRVDENAEGGQGVVAGAPAAVVRRLQSFAELGFSAFNFMVGGPDSEEQAARLAGEVIPVLRAA